MDQIADWFEEVASSLGGPGLFLVAFLDSSFISLPEINDLLVVLMVTRDEASMPYFATMATLGSICGCLVLYLLGRRGGEWVQRRLGGARVGSAFRVFERFGVMAVTVVALLPPPAPFKVFVLLSGMAKVPVLAFTGAVALGRGVRYFGEGALAVRYGDGALEFLRGNGFLVAVVVVCAGLTVFASHIFFRHRRVQGA